MSNTRTNRSQPDRLNDILGRLHGTVAKVTQLRQFLGDLESELNEICQECENEIHARSAVVSETDKDQIVVDPKRTTDVMKDIAHMADSEGLAPVSLHSQESLDPEPILTGGEKRSSVREQKRDRRTEKSRSEPIPEPKSKSERKGDPSSSILGNSSLSVVSGGSKLLQGRIWLGFMSMLHSWYRMAIPPGHAEGPPIPQPPIPTSPFPDVINLWAFPPELKREGHGWFILFNPSPKVERVLDVNLVHTLYHGSGVPCVRFSRDEKLLATACGEFARVYDMDTAVMICTLDHKGHVQTLCFSPDGEYLATGALDKRVRVWNIANRRCEKILEGHRGIIFSIDFSPNGQSLVSGSTDGTVRVWNVPHDWTQEWTFKVLTIEDHYLLRGRHHIFVSVAISPDGRYVAAGGSDSVVRIWEMTTGALVQKLKGHQSDVLSVAFTPDGKGLISGSWDTILKYWDVSGLGASTAPINGTSTSRCLMSLTGHKSAISATAASRNGAWVVSGSKDGVVLFWDMRTGVVQGMLSGHYGNIYGLDLSSSGNLLATAGRDGLVRIWAIYSICLSSFQLDSLSFLTRAFTMMSQ